MEYDVNVDNGKPYNGSIAPPVPPFTFLPSDYRTAVETAVLQTVAYVDVFDYPLTAAELHRYLIGVPAARDTIDAILANGRLIPHALARHEEYFTLPGRERIVAIRQQREALAQQLWPQARRYGRLIARLPFVRMVAVTGSLAVNNVVEDGDIDYLIVTENGRLWSCRALVILVVRLAARHGLELCPNYFLSEHALALPDHNLYAARELLQMVPLAGAAVYRRLLQLNPWTAHFLPNAHQHRHANRDNAGSAPRHRSFSLLETFLRSPAGHYIEQWEMARKIRKFSRQGGNGTDPTTEADFSPHWCKGHFEGHGERTIKKYGERLQKLERNV